MSLLETKKALISPLLFFLLSLVSVTSGSDEEFELVSDSKKPSTKKKSRSQRKHSPEESLLNAEPSVPELMMTVQDLKKQINDNQALNLRKITELKTELLMLTGNSPTYKRLIRLDAPFYISLALGTAVYSTYIWNGAYDPTTFMSTVYSAYFFLTMLMRYATVINRP